MPRVALILACLAVGGLLRQLEGLNLGAGKGGGGTREAEGNGAAGCPFASRHFSPRRAATPYLKPSGD